MKFTSMLWNAAKMHPWKFILFIVLVVVLLGGLVWTGVAFVIGLIGRVSSSAGSVAASGAAALKPS